MARRLTKQVAKRRVGRRPTRSAQRATRAIPPAPQRLHNLPVQLSTFIGREQEIEEVKRILGTTRLLTLTGSGGCGKTRLALQVAADILQHYPDGVRFVDLAPLADPALVPNSVAAVLDVPEQPTRPLIDTLANYLRTKTLLLILDNCEHLHEACQRLADHLLHASGSVRIMTTSREALGVEGESTYRVPPLRLPQVDHAPTVAQLSRYDAIRLFAERAALAQSGFTVTSINAPAVLQICQRLDGMPLAIEFAAARVAAMSVDQIAARLDDRFRLLTAGPKKTLARQQTLHATMDWSHDLLSAPEQTLLRRLSIFAGGFALEAAENVCAGDGVEQRDILDLLTHLVNKSLVFFEEREGQARYRLLESVRQYGADRLQESGETDGVQRHHRDWYLQFAEKADSKLRGHEQDAWLDRLETEHDNLRSALAWSKTAPDGVDAWLRLAGALTWFWYISGHWSEGRKWLDDALSGRAAGELSVLHNVVRGAQLLAYAQGDLDRVGELHEERKAVAERLGDTESAIGLRFTTANLALELGDVEWAIPLLEESVELARKLGDQWLLAFGLSQLADGVRAQGDYQRGADLCMESARLFEAVGDRWRLSAAFRSMGITLLRQRNFDRGATFFADSIRLRTPANNRWVVFQSLEGLACIATARGEYRRAATLFGAAKPIQESLRSRRDRDYQLEVKRYTELTRTSLGEQAFAELCAQGQTMTLEQVVQYALASAGLDGSTEQRRPGDDPLTVREREIVGLVARGLTNREIATTLVVSRRTADAHVQNILNKLGFNSRSQIAAWAVERGLNADPDTEATGPDAHPSQTRRAT